MSQQANPTTALTISATQAEAENYFPVTLTGNGNGNGGQDPTDETGETGHRWKPISERRKAYISWRKQISAIDTLLLNELVFLARLQKEKTGAFYCTPSHKYLAYRLLLSEEGKEDKGTRTIRRRLANLAKLKLITIIRRRSLGDNKWQTNLIKPWRGLVAMLKEANVEEALKECFSKHQEETKDDEQTEADTEETSADETHRTNTSHIVIKKCSEIKNNNSEKHKNAMEDTSVLRGNLKAFSKNKEEEEGSKNKEKELESLWRELLKTYQDFPEVPPWTEKEETQARDLHKRYSDYTTPLIIYAVKDWGTAKSQLNMLPPLPVWNAFYYHRDTFFALMLASQKSVMKSTESVKKIEQWEKETTNGGQSLSNLFKTARAQIRKEEAPGQVAVA